MVENKPRKISHFLNEKKCSRNQYITNKNSLEKDENLDSILTLISN